MNYRSITDINAFVKRNNLLGVKQCLAENPDCINNVDAEGLTPLHWAALDGHESIVRFLVENGCHRTPKSIEEGHTPLAYAAIRGRVRIYSYLISQGVEDVPDLKGYLALHHAAMYNRVEILFITLFHCDIDVEDSFGHTPLMWAVYEGHQQSIEYLILEGANVNHRDKKGWTALTWAVFKKRLAPLETLLKHGGDINILDNESKSMLTIAKESAGGVNSGITGIAMVEYVELILSDTAGTIASKGKDVYYKWAYFNWAPLVFIYVVSVLSLVPYFIIALPIAICGLLFAWRYYGSRRWVDLNNSRNTFLMGQVWWGFTFSTILWFFYILPRDENVYSYLNIVFFIWGVWFTFIYHTLLFRDPGILEKNTVTKEEIKKSLEDGIENQYCLSCRLKKPSRSKHCKVTGNCVARFDHYCPWITNAVGVANQNHFLATVVSVVLGHFIFIYICITCMN